MAEKVDRKEFRAALKKEKLEIMALGDDDEAGGAVM